MAGYEAEKGEVDALFEEFDADGNGAITAKPFADTANGSVATEAFNDSPMRSVVGRVEVADGTTAGGLPYWDVSFLDYAGAMPNTLSCSTTTNGVSVTQEATSTSTRLSGDFTLTFQGEETGVLSGTAA